MSDEPEDPKDKVGYKNPPKEHRFKPGQSGNVYGRAGKPTLMSLKLAELISSGANVEVRVTDRSTNETSLMKNLEVYQRGFWAQAARNPIKATRIIDQAFAALEEIQPTEVSKNELSPVQRRILDRALRREKPPSPVAGPKKVRSRKKRDD